MSTSESLLSEHEAYMRRAMEIACQNLQRPFGALLVDSREGEVLASAVNRAYRNPIAHSELEVIHEAVRRFAGDVRWHDCTLYVTAEPCPMCMSAILWTGIPRVIFGTRMNTLRTLGYRHIALPAETVLAAATGDLGCELVGGILETECDALFAAAIKLEKKSKASV